MKLNTSDKLGLISVCLCFLWRPLNAWYVSVDGAGRLPFFLMLFIFICNFREIWRYSFVKPSIIYTLLGIYMVANGLIKGSPSVYPQSGMWIMVTHIMGPIIAMLIIVACARKDFISTARMLSIGTLLFCILSVLNSSMNEGRLNSEINANEMAMYGAVTTSLYAIRYICGSSKFTFSLVVIPVALVILTGSRMGFAMIALILVTVVVVKADLKRPSTILKAIILLVLGFFAVEYIMHNTLLGERLLNTAENSDNMQMLRTGTVLDYYGDRGFQYYYSWPFFLDNPIWGIGFHKWMLYSPTGHVCHSEFMVQYVECGLAAFIPWCIFWFCLFKPLRFIRKHSSGKIRNLSLLIIATLISLLYADTVLWSYNMYCVFIVYALAISFPRTLKINE